MIASKLMNDSFTTNLQIIYQIFEALHQNVCRVRRVQIDKEFGMKSFKFSLNNFAFLVLLCGYFKAHLMSNSVVFNTNKLLSFKDIPINSLWHGDYKNVIYLVLFALNENTSNFGLSFYYVNLLPIHLSLVYFV